MEATAETVRREQEGFKSSIILASNDIETKKRIALDSRVYILRTREDVEVLGRRAGRLCTRSRLQQGDAFVAEIVFVLAQQ